MNSPDTLSAKLARQWNHADTREERLTSGAAWPLRIPIGRPPPRSLSDDLDAVRSHIRAWEDVAVGTVEWEAVPYRSASGPVRVPLVWQLEQPSHWIDACRDGTVRDEYATLRRLCAKTGQIFHRILIRKRHLWREKKVSEVIQAARLADELEPDCAEGRPLRSLSRAGIDSKFYENHQTLLTNLLDARFAGRVGEVGLETFLGAAREGEHWLLLADLGGGLLPFAQQRVRASELAAQTDLPGTHLILVENERSLHQLPAIQGGLAILGSGLNLSWLAAAWLGRKRIAYWGDLDTWGLQMLGTARRHLPHLTALLMDEATYDRFAADFAVPEPHPAEAVSPGLLSRAEQRLLALLAGSERGRLEQEFLPREFVRKVVEDWCHGRGGEWG